MFFVLWLQKIIENDSLYSFFMEWGQTIAINNLFRNICLFFFRQMVLKNRWYYYVLCGLGAGYD